MKKFILLLLLSAGFLACTKPSYPPRYMSTATLKGRSMFKNMCSARYWIIINDPSAGNTFDELPAGSGINPDFESFTDSIRVWVNWHNTGTCGRVVIDAIRKMN